MENIVYSKTNCPHCVRAKQLLNKLNIPFVEKLIQTQADKDELLIVVPAAQSVPQIFLDGFLVGGADELYALYENDRLLTSKNGKVFILNVGE